MFVLCEYVRMWMPTFSAALKVNISPHHARAHRTCKDLHVHSFGYYYGAVHMLTYGNCTANALLIGP